MKFLALLITLLMTYGVSVMAVKGDGIVRMVTLKNGHKIWTKTSRHGKTPIMLLHGGPGLTHEAFECFEQFLVPKGFKVILYDQLDCHNSDKPNDPALWTIERFCDEVEEVRQGLGLEQIYLLGFSWGAVLAMEYTLKYQQNLKGVILSGFTASAESFEEHMQHLLKTLPVEAQQTIHDLEAKGEVGGEVWQSIMETYFYPRYFCGLNPLPEPWMRSMSHFNWPLCFHFFGKNDFVVEGAFKSWNRWPDLHKITVPALVIIGENDLCSADDAKKMAALMLQGAVHIAPGACHAPFYENPTNYFAALLNFLNKNRENA